MVEPHMISGGHEVIEATRFTWNHGPIVVERCTLCLKTRRSMRDSRHELGSSLAPLCPARLCGVDGCQWPVEFEDRFGGAPVCRVHHEAQVRRG